MKAKLTDSDRFEIFILYYKYHFRALQIAKKYGVTKERIRTLVNKNPRFKGEKELRKNCKGIVSNGCQKGFEAEEMERCIYIIRKEMPMKEYIRKNKIKADTVSFGISLDESVFNELKKMCNKTGLSKTSLITIALTFFSKSDDYKKLIYKEENKTKKEDYSIENLE